MLGHKILWFIINCNTYFRLTPFFWHSYSQGSVATCLRRGGKFKHNFVANLLLSLSVKTVLKSVNIWWNYGQEFGVLFLFDSQCRSNAPHRLLSTHDGSTLWRQLANTTEQETVHLAGVLFGANWRIQLNKKPIDAIFLTFTFTR